MPAFPVYFFNEDSSLKLRNKRFLKKWICECIASENSQPEELNIIFCSDAYLADMNRRYLQHDTFTDIITFDQSEREGWIKGDIFISTDRVAENASAFQTTFENELSRVMIHGVLHLLGYKDKTAADKQKMREKEDYYLSKQEKTAYL